MIGRPVRLLVAVALAAPVLAAWWAEPAGAVGQLDVGMWWRTQPDGGSLPAPPQVPAGGLWVSSDPTGASAISAVRFTLAPGESVPVLSLTVAKLSAPPATPATPAVPPVKACVTTADWKPTTGPPGAWSSRPAYDCTKGEVQGQLSSDSTTMTFDLAPVATSNPLSLAIIPGEIASPVPAPPVPAPPAPPPGLPNPPSPASGTLSPTFDLTFKAPQPSDVAVAVAPSTPPPAPAPVLPAAAVEAPAPLPAVLSAPPVYSPATFTPPAAPSAPAVVPPPAPAPAVSRSVVRRIVHLAASPISRSLRQLALSLLVGLAIWAWQLRSGDAFGLAADGLVDVADVANVERPAGLRRFGTGERVGKPPSLR